MSRDYSKSKPRYSGPDRSGICVCGHPWHEHHLGCVAQIGYFEATKEAYIPDECCHYGFNEDGGLDAEGNVHCFGYRDEREASEETS